MNKSKGTLQQQIYTKILYKIVNGEYPYDQFLTESALVNEFGVSRILVREALIELRKDNILKSIPRAGYQIVQISGSEIRDAIRTRAILEVGSARYAIHSITEEELEQLSRLIQEADEAYENGKNSLVEWWERNVEFHSIIAKASGNALLIEMIDKAISILWRAAIQYFMTRDPNTYNGFHPGAHKKILKALREKDETALVKLIHDDATSMSTLFSVD